jgi:iron(III) transport system substrate-binding protein
MQKSFADLGLLPVTSKELPGVDPAVAEVEKSKLLGTTDAAKMDKMLVLAREIYP